MSFILCVLIEDLWELITINKLQEITDWGHCREDAKHSDSLDFEFYMNCQLSEVANESMRI